MQGKNIMPYNDKGQRHGWWEIYGGGRLSKEKLAYKGYCKNGVEIGFWHERDNLLRFSRGDNEIKHRFYAR